LDKKEFALAKKLNGQAPGYLAKVAKKIKAVLVHYSTDYVFDGDPEIELEPGGCTHSCANCHLHKDFAPQIGYREDAVRRPISAYGKTKLWGERAVEKYGQKYYLIRLSRLFGKIGKGAEAKRSFFGTMLEAGKKLKKVSVIDEETSCFTYAPDLAKKTKEIIESRKPFGTYHISNGEPCTWYEAVVELYKQAKIKTKIVPILGDKYPRPAKRPYFSVLLNTKLNPLRSYRSALKDFLKSQKG
jgi:dTDP-4-dehydrorhamnose reductase